MSDHGRASVGGVSAPVDPYAPPDPDALPRGPEHRPDAPEPPPFGAPRTQSPLPAPKGSGNRDVLVLVLGILALASSWTLFGAVAFGMPAVLLGSFARRRARAESRSAGFPIAGIALGLSSLAVAGGILFSLQDDLQRFEDCRRASFSVAQDKVCQQQLENVFRVG